MRPAFVVVIWIALMGGLTLYMQSRETAVVGESYELHAAEGAFALRITTTFPVEPDPFALRTDDREASALLVKVNGKEILRRTDRVRPGEPIQLEPVPGLTDGRNEFYLEANPPLDDANLSYAIRAQLFRDGKLIADRSFWSEPGSRIASSFEVSLAKEPAVKDHDNE
ncbi:MAG: hypothetical protein RDU20_10390 [Desulfomonilaceae bacterium]|nr:hypothetical protein [Desulfomonilaceae bacterium]